MKIMVTGAAGFIGGYVVEELIERGYEVLMFDRAYHFLDLNLEADEWGSVDFQLGDIRDANAVTEAMAHADGWIHLAGVLGTAETIKNPRPAAETNILGGLNVLEAAAQYDLPGVNIAVGNFWMDNTYSITKTTVERFAQMYRVERGTPVSVMRALNAYGPRQSVAAPYGNSKVRKITPSFVCRALCGQAIEIYGDGTQIMDMVFVADVARDLVDCLIDTIGNGPYDYVLQSGPGLDTTVNDIAEEVWNAIDHLEFGEYASGHSQHSVIHLPMRAGEPEKSIVKATYPFGSEYRSLKDGIYDTVEWFADNEGAHWSAL